MLGETLWRVVFAICDADTLKDRHGSVNTWIGLVVAVTPARGYGATVFFIGQPL